MRRLCVWIALLLAAAGLSGCAIDGAIMGRPGGPDAAKLLADSRSALGAQDSIRIVRRERTRGGQPATTIISLQFGGIDLVLRQRGGIDADLRVLDGRAWSRGNPRYWASAQGLTASQIPLVSRGWNAMRLADLHLPAWFVHALGNPSLLERCEIPSIPGGRLSLAGHEAFDGHAATVLADRARHGAERERIVLDSAPPHLPEQIALSGGLPADPACGVSAAAGRTVRSATVSFEDANRVRIPRPRATLSEARYEALLGAAAGSPSVP